MMSLGSVKTAVGTAAATMASGFASFVGLIPDDIGKVVSVIGGALSVVMMKYWMIQTKKAKVELQILIIERDKKADARND